jgi:hypothetical protein
MIQTEHTDDCGCARCREVQREAAGLVLVNRVMTMIETLDDKQQTKVIECGMRMRELACFYGPYFRMALSLTSAEIAAGILKMPKVANCDASDALMLPADYTPGGLILPGNDAKH